MGADVLHIQVGGGVIPTGPDDENVSVGHDGESRRNLIGVGGAVDADVVRAGESSSGVEEARVNINKSLPASLPDNGSSAFIEHGHLRLLLIAGGALVDTERAVEWRKIIVEAKGADAEALAIDGIVLPDDVPAIGVDADARPELVSGQTAERVLAALGRKSLRPCQDRRRQKQPQKEEPPRRAQQQCHMIS